MVVMKRTISVILVGLIAWAAFAEDELEFYTNQFNNALTAVERLSILRIVRDAEIEDAGSLYAYALKRVVQGYTYLNGHKERDAADESIRLITDQLTEDQSDTGQDLWKVTQVFTNPLVRADAVMALGKVGATDLIPHVVQLLKETNASPYASRISGERLAYGAIDALSKYKDPSGYLPVFFAANGWYSQRVKDKAVETLAEILEDPTEPLTEVIQNGAYTYQDKYLALMAVEKAEVDESSKAGVAVAALSEGWKGFTNNPLLKRDQLRLRKLAIDMISRYGTDDENVCVFLERSYRYGLDEEEQLGVIKALQKIATEDAVKQLSAYIESINNKFERGILTPQDERYMRALIPALGSTGNAEGRPALRHILSLDWSAGIHQIAQEALDNLGT
jgi:HEAT repeat protein